MKSRLMTCLYCICSSAIVSSPNVTFSHEVEVHEEITTRAVAEVLKNYHFLSELGFSETTQFNGNDAATWITLGSRYEDSGIRPTRHFFDPISGAGLNGTFLGIPYSFSAARDWALDSGANNPDYSIPEAYRHLKLALTSSDPQTREQEWATTFRGVGQFVHLIQDMTQPQHVRNDLHLSFSESLDPLFPDYSRFERYTRDRVGNLLYSGYPTVNLPTFRSYWQDDSGSQKGIAEFTNRNFVSENTIFTNYALPDIAAIVPTEPTVVQVVDLNGVTYSVVIRYWGNSYTDFYTGTPESNSYLVTASLFDFQHRQLTNTPVFSLNDVNHQAYADRLIPRAVGYSAGLITNFFRGKIDLVEVPNTPGSYTIKNKGGEDLNGTFTLYYDDVNNTRNAVPGGQWNLQVLANSESAPVNFPLPASPKSPGEFVLVFDGHVGTDANETVAGKAVLISSLYCESKEQMLVTSPNAGGNSIMRLVSLNGNIVKEIKTTRTIDQFTGFATSGKYILVTWTDGTFSLYTDQLEFVRDLPLKITNPPYISTFFSLGLPSGFLYNAQKPRDFTRGASAGTYFYLDQLGNVTRTVESVICSFGCLPPPVDGMNQARNKTRMATSYSASQSILYSDFDLNVISYSSVGGDSSVFAFALSETNAYRVWNSTSIRRYDLNNNFLNEVNEPTVQLLATKNNLYAIGYDLLRRYDLDLSNGVTVGQNGSLVRAAVTCNP